MVFSLTFGGSIVLFEPSPGIWTLRDEDFLSDDAGDDDNDEINDNDNNWDNTILVIFVLYRVIIRTVWEVE